MDKFVTIEELLKQVADIFGSRRSFQAIFSSQEKLEDYRRKADIRIHEMMSEEVQLDPVIGDS